MNTLDYIILVPVAIGFLIGLYKGLIKELSSLLAIILGIYGAKVLAPSVSGFLVNLLGLSPRTAMPVTYLVLFVGITIGLHFLAKLIDKAFESISLGTLNKILGGVFGLMKIALIASVLLNVFDAVDSKFAMVKPETKQNSVCYKPMLRLAPGLWKEGTERMK